MRTDRAEELVACRRDEMVERGSIIADSEGTLFRVLFVDDEGVWLQRIKPMPPRSVMHTRSLTWEQYHKFRYDLKFP